MISTTGWNSIAPISAAAPTTRGNPTPRWSKSNTATLLPVSIAGLPAISAWGTLHRIDPALVKKQVLAAGFEFVGESGLLRNPADDHKLKVFDKAIRGHTDQFAYKFHKRART